MTEQDENVGRTFAFFKQRDENQKRAFILCVRPLGILFFTMRCILADPQS